MAMRQKRVANQVNCSQLCHNRSMEHAVSVHIEELPEGVYLATSKVPGLVAQGRTVAEVLEIARDVAKSSSKLGWSAAELASPDDCRVSRLYDRCRSVSGPAQRVSLPRRGSQAAASRLQFRPASGRESRNLV